MVNICFMHVFMYFFKTNFKNMFAIMDKVASDFLLSDVQTYLYLL